MAELMTTTIEKIDILKNLGEYLMQFNMPVGDAETSNVINILKFTELTIDGYTFKAHYNKANYQTHFYESCQIFGKDTPFLPFSIVVKCARLVLGDDHLVLVEMLESGKKVYCWGLMRDNDGNAMPMAKQNHGEKCSFEGFHFVLMSPEYFNFY